MTVNTDKLLELADRLQPFQDELAALWARIMSPDAKATDCNNWLAKRKECNEFVLSLASEIAKATGNHEDNIRMLLVLPAVAMPAYFDSPADYLRCVAKYQSFNMNAWIRKGWEGWD